MLIKNCIEKVLNITKKPRQFELLSIQNLTIAYSCLTRNKHAQTVMTDEDKILSPDESFHYIPGTAVVDRYLA